MSAIPRHADRVPPSRRAFTLIELLVVIGVIALLVAILLPALGMARGTARLARCAGNLHQVGVGIAAYAADNQQHIPRGPHVTTDNPFGAFWDEQATNQVWIGSVGYNAHGVLLAGYVQDPRALFCPGDDTNDPTEELARVGDPSAAAAYSSFLYRQIDQVTGDRLDQLGTDGKSLQAVALAMDLNSLLAGFTRTNHQNKKVNILFLDGHATTYDNPDSLFSIRAGDFMDLPGRLDQMLVNADYCAVGDARQAPQLP